MIKTKKQLLFLRILLGVLIVCNMAAVFVFSSQNSTKSAALSQKLTISVVEWISKFKKEETTFAPEETVSEPEETTPEPEETVSEPEETVSEPEETVSEPEETTPEPEETTPEPEETTPEPEETTPEQEKPQDPFENLTNEQIAIVKKSHTPIRKLAHMLEFGTLATLVFLFLLTWPGKLLWRYAVSLGFTLVYAATDELHQLFSEGRGARLSDVFIDFAGAFILCTSAMIIVMLVRRTRKVGSVDSSATKHKPMFFVYVSQIFSRLQSFLSNQISKMKSKK